MNYESCLTTTVADQMCLKLSFNTDVDDGGGGSHFGENKRNH